jgi:V8-like Glu-specific endopeptidase
VSASLTRSASSILGLGLATIACTVGLGTTAAATHDRPALNPNRLPEIATGIARVSVRTCNGRQRSSGTGFLIGERVVMTAREVIESVRGCRAVQVLLSGKAYRGERIVYWSTGGKRDDAVADVATLKLSRKAPGSVLSFARRTPTLSTTIAVVGYPPGKPLSFKQGPLVAATRVDGIPVAAVKLVARGGTSGSAFLDPAGDIVGIAQTRLAPRPGREAVVTARKGVVWGVNLVRWWGPAIARDLCRAYPNGGTPGCRPPPQPPPGPAVAGTYAGTTTQNAKVTFEVLPGGTALKDFFVSLIELFCQPPDVVLFPESSNDFLPKKTAPIAADGSFVIAIKADNTPYDDVRYQSEIRVTGRFSGQGASGELNLELTRTIPGEPVATCTTPNVTWTALRTP